MSTSMKNISQRRCERIESNMDALGQRTNNKKGELAFAFVVWRSGRDSNPRPPA